MYNIPFELFQPENGVNKNWGGLRAAPLIQVFTHYQTRHAFARTIGCPALQPNACANSDMFPTTLLMR